jgi:hypothetical protein
MKVDVNMTGLEGVLATLQSLPPELVSKRGGPVKSALRKGAVVIALEARKNLQQVTQGEDTTGLLLENLVVTRGKAIFGSKGERYLVRVRRKSYVRKGKPVTTLKAAQLLEYGSAKQPMEPWLRPAFAAKAQQAMQTAETELVRQLDRVVKKLAKQNAGR